MPPIYSNGRKPFALVLLQFYDVPVPNIPLSRFRDYVTSSGKGGLYDWVRDVSNNNVNLDGSEVFGWFTSKYSWIKDGDDPYHDGRTIYHAREAWIAEARRLCEKNGIDLSGFAGVIVLSNANVDGGASGVDMAMDMGGYWGQADWKQCSKCMAIAFSANASKGSCHDGQPHLFNDNVTRKYQLAINNPSFDGQTNWRWCNKCQYIYWAGLDENIVNNWGSCFAGGSHNAAGSANYRLSLKKFSPTSTDKWKHCIKCHGLSHEPMVARSHCAGGGIHDHLNSPEYFLSQYYSGMNMVTQPHEVLHCLGFQHNWKDVPGGNPIEYGDPYDMMGNQFFLFSFDNKTFPRAGVGLNAPNLYKTGWIPEDRVYTVTGKPSWTTSIRLVALSRFEEPGYLAIRWETKEKVFFFEFREPDRWDQGIPSACVLVHELRSKYAVGQTRFRSCKNCNTMFEAGAAACPAGDLHAVNQSVLYRIETNLSGDSRETDWTACKDCLCIYWKPDPGNCAAHPGRGHTPPAPGEMHLGFRLSGEDSSESGWRRCKKCSVLTNSYRPGLNTCPAGGMHYHGESVAYKVNTTGSVTGAGIAAFAPCTKCNSLTNIDFGACPSTRSWHDFSGSFDYGFKKGQDDSGQDGWKVCKRCHSFVLSKFPGICITQGPHDTSSPDTYTVQGDGATTGQDGWACCYNCVALFFAPFGGSCYKQGAQHDKKFSFFPYRVGNYGDDKVYWVGSELYPSNSPRILGGSFKEGDVELSASTLVPDKHSVNVYVGGGLPPQITAHMPDLPLNSPP